MSTAVAEPDVEMTDEEIAEERETKRRTRWDKHGRPRFKYGPFVVLISTHNQNDPETGKDRQYTNASGPFMSDRDLLTLNAPGMSPKFALHGVSSIPTDPNVTIRPGESIADFAARVSAFAASAAGTPKPGDTPLLFQEQREAAERAAKARVERDATLDAKLNTLTTLSQKDLETLAADEEIELGGAVKKDEVVKMVRAALLSRKAKP